MRLFRPCFIVARLFPDALFRENTTERVLYLTFDDGPDVSSTIPLLRILASHKVKAVFFCSGKRSSENPDLMERIKHEGHVIGNHGFDHLDGVFTTKRNYLDNIQKAAPVTSGKLFRPPYGRLKINQYREIRKTFKIVFWDLMAYDFDRRFGSEKTLTVLKKMIRPGCIIVLHDSPESTVPDFLEEFILFAAGQGYRFETVN